MSTRAKTLDEILSILNDPAAMQAAARDAMLKAGSRVGATAADLTTVDDVLFAGTRS